MSPSFKQFEASLLKTNKYVAPKPVNIEKIKDEITICRMIFLI